MEVSSTTHIDKLIGILLAILLSGAPSIAFSHGGGLDSHGCHHNRKQGGYHCHQGKFKGQSFSSKDEMLKKKNKSK